MNFYKILFVFVFMSVVATASSASAQYEAYIREGAAMFSLPEAFVTAVIRTESNFNPVARSRVGAVGLMQLMPVTARTMGVSDRTNPHQNVLGGCRYLRLLANRYNGDFRLTVAAYNAGPGAIIRAGGQVPRHVEPYLNAVVRRFHYYNGR